MTEMPLLAALMPYLEQIQSTKLRDSVSAVWEDLFQESEWGCIYDVPCDLGVTSISLLKHTCNVTNYAIHAAQVYYRGYDELNINTDYLIAGCLLHDVSKLLEYRPILGQIIKTDLAEIYVEQFFGMNAAFRRNIPIEVIHMIVSNTPKTNCTPATPEALILYFCERIDMDVRNKLAGRSLRAKDKNYLITHMD